LAGEEPHVAFCGRDAQAWNVLAGEAAVSGAALIGASATTRWGVFHTGMASARDPKYTVVPQRQRLAERARETAARPGSGF
jgi:hypothetical protein